MNLLEKKITSDWIDIREKLTTPVRLKNYLKLEDRSTSILPDELRRASLEGTTEFKRKLCGGVFSFLSRLGFSTPNQAEILSCEADLRTCIYLIGIQNLFFLGLLKPVDDPETSSEAESARNRIPVDQVYQEITARLNDNPDLAKDTHVKNILMEIQMYKKEFAQFAALSPKIPDDRAPSFFANFKQRLDGIINNISSHYREILMEEDAELRKEFRKQEEESFVSQPLSKLMGAQAQELSFLRSTILFALQEGYQIRTLLLKLTQKKDPFFALLDEEMRILDSKQEPGTTGHGLSIKLARNVAHALEGNMVKKGA